MLRVLDRRIVHKGDVVFPCVPELANEFAKRLLSTWELLGRPFSAAESEQLRETVRLALSNGYEFSPHGVMAVNWEAKAPPDGRLLYQIRLHPRTLEDKYNDWLTQREGPLFGKAPDAKVMTLAATLGEPQSVNVLDLGAGTGRNALALAGLGHRVDAVEVVSAFCETMQRDAAARSLPIRVVQSDMLADDTAFEASHYRLAVVSEVVTHLRDVDEVRCLFRKLAGAMAAGGLVVLNAFLGRNGFVPDVLARQLGYTSFASLFSASELEFIVRDLPFELVSNEDAHAFERAQTPAALWPPTTWFESWSRGSNIFDLPQGTAPVELRWLVYRRK